MAQVPLSTTPDFNTALIRLYESSDTLTPRSTWLQAMQELGAILGGEAALLAQFSHIWRRLYTATLLLDHLQDGDDIDEPWLAAQPLALQYHLAFSAYVVAQQELMTLQSDPARAMKLQTLWSSSVHQLAVGQYRDLTLSARHLESLGSEALDYYEAVASQKTGAAFALAFGGSATLATNDTAHVRAATHAGRVFGMLLQYSDDLLDAPAQEAQPTTLTLSRALAATSNLPAELTASAYWSLIYASYWEALVPALAPLPQPAQNVFWNLLRTTFGDPPNTSGATTPTTSTP